MYTHTRYNKEQKQIASDMIDSIAAIEAYITGSLVDSREKSMAITKLDEALMWIGSAVAVGLKEPEKPKKCEAEPEECPFCKILEEMKVGDEKTIEIRCVEE